MTHEDSMHDRIADALQNNNVQFCPACDAEIDKEIRCEVCRRRGCVDCLPADPETGERRCEENCYEQALEKAAKRTATSGSNDDLREYLRLRRRRLYEERQVHMEANETNQPMTNFFLTPEGQQHNAIQCALLKAVQSPIFKAVDDFLQILEAQGYTVIKIQR